MTVSPKTKPQKKHVPVEHSHWVQKHFMKTVESKRGGWGGGTWLKLGDSLSDALHDAGSLVAQH